MMWFLSWRPLQALQNQAKTKLPLYMYSYRLCAVKQQLYGFTIHLKPGSQYDSEIDSISIIVLRNYRNILHIIMYIYLNSQYRGILSNTYWTLALNNYGKT